MPVGEPVPIAVPLDAVARRVPAGYRLRLSVATQAWPLTWPEPGETTLRFRTDTAALSLPCLPQGVAVDAPHPPEDAAVPVAEPVTPLRKGAQDRAITRNPDSGQVTRTETRDHGSFRVEETGIIVESAESQSFSVMGNDPLSATADLTNRVSLSRGNWSIRLENEVTVTADATHFHLREACRAYESDTLVHSEETENSIPRV